MESAVRNDELMELWAAAIAVRKGTVQKKEEPKPKKKTTKVVQMKPKEEILPEPVKEEPKPVTKIPQKIKAVKNLAELKRALTVGTIFTISHGSADWQVRSGIREVAWRNTVSITSKDYNNPNGENSTANDGKGVYLYFEKAVNWKFNEDGSASFLNWQNEPSFTIWVWETSEETAEEKQEPDRKIMEVINAMKKIGAGNRVNTDIYTQGEKLVCCDGYRLLLIQKGTHGIEQETDRQLYDYEKMLQFVRDCTDDPLIAPDLKTLKELEKKAKDEFKARTGRKSVHNRSAYKFDNGLVVNVKYLMDGIKATGSREVIHTEKLNNPIMLKSEDGTVEYLLCPVAPNGYEGHENECYILDR